MTERRWSMAKLARRAHEHDERGDVVLREQCAREYRELATDAEWASRPEWVAGRPGTIWAWDAGRRS